MPGYSPICVDASLLLRLVMTPGQMALKQQWQQWLEVERRDVIAPALLHYEVTNAIHQYHRSKQISAQTARETQTFLLEMPIRLYQDAALHQSALALSRRLSLAATYDAHYLALAERMGASFWTADKRLFNSVSGQLNWIHLWQEA
jgi:predicted nucleic acid-binding protein